jgi:hypothetical protein
MKMIPAVIVIIVLVSVCGALGRTWNIHPSGSGDAPTIQAGIDSAAAGDTVRVNSGTYYEHDIQMKSGILLMHINSIAGECIIDAQGQGRVMLCDGVDETARIWYFTFTGGHAAGTGSAGCGGAILFTNSSAPEVLLSICQGNVADNLGGAVYCEDHSDPSIDQCVFHENQAGIGGGALACVSYSGPSVVETHIWANLTGGNGGGVYCGDFASPYFQLSNLFNCVAAGHGGALYSESNGSPVLENCMLVFSMDGEGAYAADDMSIPYFRCCDIFGNQGGDWIGRIADQSGADYNFSLNPLFCDSTDVEPTHALHVETCSPCFRGNPPSGSCGDIGYVYTGCDCGEAAEPVEWGAIKALYR